MHYNLNLFAYFLFIVAVLATDTTITSYDGYKTYRIVPGNKENANLLKQLESAFNLDFWTEIRSLNKGVDVMVKPEWQHAFESLLKLYNINYQIWIEDVQRHLQLRDTVKNVRSTNKIDLTKYHTHEEINEYLEELVKSYPDIVSIESVGRSYEGRDMKAIIIATGGNKTKPGILIDGGIHAREWAASAEVLCIISQLLEDENNRNLIENVDWFILPLVNPDGFTYSRTNDKLWRKTRSIGKRCDGVDANRNFDFHWNEDGGSSNECSETFSGMKSFSEIEALNLANFALKYKERLKLYLTFHSYGQYILYPWGYDVILPSNSEELRILGENVGKAIYSVYGTEYTVANSAAALYPAAGASDDWMKGVAGIPLVYTIELPGGGSNGFDLPPDRLKEVCTETLEGIKIFQKHIQDNYT